ncbi:hypothetical protein V5O48_016000 [Marasmius crinis-equi]|uniref:Uncharacterized protein n=1 Tax=Marasmius crinis-equi TaxID=585013 RepID=A0ABR3ESZ7_9AGAR
MSQLPNIPLDAPDNTSHPFLQHLHHIRNSTASPATPILATGTPGTGDAFEGAQNENAAGTNSSWESGGPESAGHLQQWNLTGGLSGSTQAPTRGGWPLFTLEDGRALKRGRMLSAHSEREYDEYLKDREKGPTVAMARSYLALLETRDHVKEIKDEVRSRWKPDPPLIKALKEYTNHVLLSPRLHAYRGKKLQTMIIEVMRKLGVSDLPAAHDLGRVDQCVGIVTRYLTDQRYILKQKIGQSVYKEDGTYSPVDIGTMFEDCVGASRIPVSLPALVRFAYLRSVWVALYKEQLAADGAGGTTSKTGEKRKNGKEPTLNELRNDFVDFWLYVDNDLKKIRKMCEKPEELAAGFKAMYDNDVKEYGSNNTPVTELKDLDAWLTDVHNAAALAVNTGETEEGSKTSQAE